MADDIQWPDIKMRASIQDDTASGAKSIKKNIDELLAVQKGLRDRGGGSSGEGNEFNRALNDQKTTGLGPLGRAASKLISEHLGTGLAIGGAAVAAAQFNEMATGAKNVTDQLKAGTMQSDELGFELGKQVPIFGSLLSGVEALKEVFTGYRHELEFSKQLTEMLVTENDRLYEAGRKLGELRREDARGLAQGQRESDAIGLRGITAQRQAIVDTYKSKKDANDKAREDAKMEAGGAASAEEDALTKYQSEKGQRILDLQESLKHKVSARGVGLNALTAGGSGAVDGALDASRQKELDGLIAGEDQLKDAVARRGRQANQALGEKTKTADARDAQDEIEKNRALAEQNRLYKEGLKITAETADVDKARSSGEAAAEALGTGGNVEAAAKKRIEVQVAADQQSAIIAAEGRLNATQDADEKAQIQHELAMKLASIQQKGSADIAAADKSAYVERRKAAYDTAEATADAEASGHAQALREAGKGYEAERALRARELQRQKDDIDEAAAQAILQNRDNQKQILDKAAADKSKLDADYKEKARQAKEGEIAGETGIAKDLIGGRIDALKSEASVGSIAAAAEAKRLEIASQFLEKRAAINKLIRDPNVSEAEKNLAKQQLAGLDAQQSRAEQMALFTGGAAIPSLNISSRGSGSITKAMEENSPFIMLQKINAKNGETLEAIKAATAGMFAVFNKNPILVPLFGGKP